MNELNKQTKISSYILKRSEIFEGERKKQKKIKERERKRWNHRPTFKVGWYIRKYESMVRLKHVA